MYHLFLFQVFACNSMCPWEDEDSENEEYCGRRMDRRSKRV
jgi:hypothetical protein